MASKVTVLYRGALADEVGVRGEVLSAATVRGVLRHVRMTYGTHAYKAAKSALIVVNGTAIHLDKAYATPLAEGDTIGFYPMGAGG